MVSLEIHQVGIDHHLAPLDVRERIALGADVQVPVALAVKREGWAEEVALLSTCNRTELYVASAEPTAGEQALGALLRRLPHAPPPDSGCYRRLSGAAAAKHLMRVACGLESAILGETEIQGQVRTAHARGLEGGTVGPVLDRLFQAAVRVGKRARRDTRISSGGTSHGSAAAQVVRRAFDDLEGRRVLILGAGTIATQAARAMADLVGGRYVVANRTEAHARALADQLPDACVAGLDAVSAELETVRVAILATGADPLSTGVVEAALKKRREPLLLVDLGVPRCVDAAVADLAGVFLYDLEALEEMVAGSLAARREAVPAVEAIVRGELEAYRTWQRGLRAAPAIRSLNQWAESIRRTEVGYLPEDLPPEVRAAVERMSKRLVQRLLGRAAARVVKGAGAEDPHLPTPQHLLDVFGLDDGDDS
jgi:glutamyl-tRNA reductase